MRQILVLRGVRFFGWPNPIYLPGMGFEVSTVDRGLRWRVRAAFDLYLLVPAWQLCELIRLWRNDSDISIKYAPINLRWKFERLLDPLEKEKPDTIVLSMGQCFGSNFIKSAWYRGYPFKNSLNTINDIPAKYSIFLAPPEAYGFEIEGLNINGQLTRKGSKHIALDIGKFSGGNNFPRRYSGRRNQEKLSRVSM